MIVEKFTIGDVVRVKEGVLYTQISIGHGVSVSLIGEIGVVVDTRFVNLFVKFVILADPICFNPHELEKV